MKVGIVGGTGNQGTGIAKRILKNTDHFVFIGSRNKEKGKKHAESLKAVFPMKKIDGGSNEEAMDADIVILAIPFESVEPIVFPHKELLKDRIVIDCINPLVFKKKGVFLDQPNGKSVTEWIGENLGIGSVVAGFKTISAGLLNSDEEISQDCFVASDDNASKEKVMSFVSEVLNTRVIDAGGAFTARYLESMTALAININKNYKKKDAGFKILI